MLKWLTRSALILALVSATTTTAAAQGHFRESGSQPDPVGLVFEEIMGISLIAVGGAAIIAGSVTGGLALADNHAATRGCIDGHCPAYLRPKAHHAYTFAQVTDFVLLGGVALGLVGGWYLLSSFMGWSNNSNAYTVNFGCFTTGCSASVQGRF